MIDAHIHCFPPEISNDVHAWAEQYNEPHWLQLVAPVGKKSLQGWASMETTLKSMDRAGVEKSILLGWYWEHKATCIRQNELMHSWLEQAPDRFIGFASIHPQDNPIDQLERAKAMGFRGVGELHPGLQQYSKYKSEWQTLADWCSSEHWPINLHVTEGLNHAHDAYIPTPFDNYLELAIRFPDLRIILAHWGGGIPFYEQNPRIKTALKNVYYDTAASPLLYSMDIFKNIVNLVGPNKLIFGSDFPLRLFPKKTDAPNMKNFIDAIKAIGLSEETRAALFKNTICSVLDQMPVNSSAQSKKSS